jgi:phospholipase C
MPAWAHRSVLLAALPLVVACTGGGEVAPGLAGGHVGRHADATRAPDPPATSAIRHLVVVVQENHSFDAYFGRYCTAPSGSSPTCTEGPGCCEAAPERGPHGELPASLDDDANRAYDPRHDRACEVAEMNGGAMDRFAGGAGDGCGDPRNFAIATADVAAPYHALAAGGALADRYFQPVAGASSANDMFFARAGFVFDDNAHAPLAIGLTCSGASADKVLVLDDLTIADLLAREGVSFRFYAEGYLEMAAAESAGSCPPPPADCVTWGNGYPCTYDPSDDPFAYYARLANDPRRFVDLAAFGDDLDAGRLPAVSFVRAIGYKTEHPGSTISAGTAFVEELVARVDASSAAPGTLVLVTWDESGGFYDHVRPPPPSSSDGQPYGPRVPLLALGPFARKDAISHVPMEHSSIVRFIEWNWLGGRTGQLGTRDGEVNGIGSLLDLTATGTAVP